METDNCQREVPVQRRAISSSRITPAYYTPVATHKELLGRVIAAHKLYM